MIHGADVVITGEIEGNIKSTRAATRVSNVKINVETITRIEGLWSNIKVPPPQISLRLKIDYPT